MVHVYKLVIQGMSAKKPIRMCSNDPTSLHYNKLYLFSKLNVKARDSCLGCHYKSTAQDNYICELFRNILPKFGDQCMLHACGHGIIIFMKFSFA